MPRGLRRIYDRPHLHFITCSCYRRAPLLGTVKARDTFVRILESIRKKLRFLVVGFVVMPEHFHMLISKPETGDPSTVMHDLKQKVATTLLPMRSRRTMAQRTLWDEDERVRRHFFQARFHDFNVYSDRKRIEKLRYMHRNPVKRGLVSRPDLWGWSSYRTYAYGEELVAKIERLGARPLSGIANRTERAKAEGPQNPTLF